MNCEGAIILYKKKISGRNQLESERIREEMIRAKCKANEKQSEIEK